MRALEVRPTGAGMPSPAVGRVSGEPVWHTSWACVGVDAQIPAPGDLLPATLGDLGLHVQRESDGSLRARFNALQHGSCWTVPAQCRSGHKIRCPYVSCAFSQDTDAIAAGDGGAPHPSMRQFTGGSPGRLRSVAVTTLGPLLFVALDPAGAPSLDEQVGEAVELSGVDLDALPYLTRVNATLDCAWDEAPPLVASLAADPALRPELGTDAGEGSGAVTVLPPNATLATLDDHVAVVVVKPAGPERCQAMVALFGPPKCEGPAPEERALAELRVQWRRALGT